MCCPADAIHLYVFGSCVSDLLGEDGVFTADGELFGVDDEEGVW